MLSWQNTVSTTITTYSKGQHVAILWCFMRKPLCDMNNFVNFLNNDDFPVEPGTSGEFPLNDPSSIRQATPDNGENDNKLNISKIYASMLCRGICYVNNLFYSVTKKDYYPVKDKAPWEYSALQSVDTTPT